MPEPTVTVKLRFDPTLYDWARAAARAKDKSLNQWIQDAVATEVTKLQVPCMETFKVWVQVERIDWERGDDKTCENVGLPDPIAEFDTKAEAFAFVRSLPGWAFAKETSDYRA